jgi:hypothetical protein
MMGDVIVMFDDCGKFKGIMHDPKDCAVYPAIKMRIEDYERFLLGVPRAKRRFEDAIVYGGRIIRETKT